MPTFPPRPRCVLADPDALLCGPVWCAMPSLPGIVSKKASFFALADLAWWIEHHLED